MEARVVVTTELQLKGLIADALGAVFKYQQPTPTQPAEKIYTKSEAAKFLNITEPTLSGYISDRKIPFCKPTEGKVYFLHSDLIDWLKKHRTATISEQVVQYEQKCSARRTRKGGVAA